MSHGLSPAGLPGREPRIEWDGEAAASHAVDVATCCAGQHDVIIAVGNTKACDGFPDERAVDLLLRVSLPPRTAQALRDMLRDMIAAIDAERPRAP